MPLSRHLQFALLPGRCLLCDAPSRRFMDLCSHCQHDLPWLLTACDRCALPLFSADSFCLHCLSEPPPFEQTCCAFFYAWPISHLVNDFKTNGNLTSGRILAELVCHSQPRPMVDLIIPVPLHPRAQRKRGFNQAGEIASRLSTYWDIRLDAKNCQRVRNTKMQKQLKRADRLRNLRGAFSAKQDFQGERSLIVDDVITTAATVSALSSLLLSRGAGAISVMGIARTLK